MKRLLLFLICVSQLVFAQDEYFDQYIYNLKTINPAFAGIENEQNFDFQLVSSLNDPSNSTTAQLSYSNKISKINSGVGAIFLSKRAGSFTNTKASLLYNYQFRLNDISKLSVGTEVKYQKQLWDYSGLIISDPDDVLIVDSKTSSSNVDFDLGVLYQFKDFYAGLGTENLLQTQSGNGVEKQNIRNFDVFVMNEFRFNNIKLTPSILFKANFENNWILDVNATVELYKWVMVGSILRIDNEGELYPVFNIGVNIKDKVQIINSIYNRYRQQSKIGNAIEVILKVKINTE